MKKWSKVCRILIPVVILIIVVGGILLFYLQKDKKGEDKTGQDVTADQEKPFESSLPTVYLSADGDIWEDYLDAAMRIVNGKTSENQTVYTEDELYDGNIQIKVRGNSTKYRDKAPYKIKLETKADLLGMGSNKHWVLLANDIDHTLIRNKLVLDFAREIGMTTASESKLVTVYLNGEYEGVYQLCEQIRVGKERIDIYDWEDTFGKDEALAAEQVIANQPQTGGFILEADFYSFWDDSLSKVTTAFQQPFYFRTPEHVSEDTELYRYTKNYIQSFEYALHSDNFVYHSDDTHYAGEAFYYDWNLDKWHSQMNECEYQDATFDGCHYSQLFDMDSLVQNFLVCEMTMNWDCMKNSVFLYKDIDGLAYMGPVWDFDWAFGNMNMYNIDTDIPEDWQTTNNYFTNEQYYQSVQWNRYLIRDPYFLMKVYEKYTEERQGAIQNLMDSIDSYETELSLEAEQNDSRWDYTYTGRYYGGATPEYFHDAMDSLREFVDTRVEWLDKQFKTFDTLVESLGYYTRSDLLAVTEINGISDDLFEAQITVADPAIKKVELQINGIHFIVTDVSKGHANTEIDAELLTQDYNMIQIRALDSSGNYLHISETPEAAAVSNYFLLQRTN